MLLKTSFINHVVKLISPNHIANLMFKGGVGIARLKRGESV